MRKSKKRVIMDEEPVIPPQDIYDAMVYGDTKTCKVRYGKSVFYCWQRNRALYLVPSIQNMFG